MLQPLGEVAVDLECREIRYLGGEEVGCEARSGPDLEGVIAEVDAPKRPRDYLVLDGVTPVSGSALPAVETVHDSSPSR